MSLFAQIQINPMTAALGSSGMILVVLLLLLVMSVWTWFVIGSRAWYLWQTKRGVGSFRQIFARHRDLDLAHRALSGHENLPHFKLLSAICRDRKRHPEADSRTLERTLHCAAEPLVEELESGLNLLATVAASAPFIGLFGTVWGIMLAFGGLSDESNVLQSVAPHISQALVATAVGLMAAIPAVIAYNSLGRVCRRLVTDLDGFGLELLNLSQLPSSGASLVGGWKEVDSVLRQGGLHLDPDRDVGSVVIDEQDVADQQYPDLPSQGLDSEMSEDEDGELA